MVVRVPEKIQQKVLEDFLDFLTAKTKKKGGYSFNSPLEVFGKLSEEVKEVLDDLHKKDWNNYKNELMDVAIVALWGIMSMESQPTNSKGNK